MRAGLLVAGMIVFLLSASFFYIPKTLATPPNSGELPDANRATLEKPWAIIGMVIGGIIMVVALLLPKARFDRRKSPMKGYEKTSAGKDDGMGIDTF